MAGRIDLLFLYQYHDVCISYVLLLPFNITPKFMVTLKSFFCKESSRKGKKMLPFNQNTVKKNMQNFLYKQLVHIISYSHCLNLMKPKGSWALSFTFVGTLHSVHIHQHAPYPSISQKIKRRHFRLRNKGCPSTIYKKSSSISYEPDFHPSAS